MDPIANLREQRELIARIRFRLERADPIAGISDANRAANEDDAERLVELVEALDEWRRTGGFDPWAAEPVDEDTGRAVQLLGVTARICRSAGADKAPVVFVDTDENLEGDTGSPGPRIRIRLNDHAVYEGVPHVPAEEPLGDHGTDYCGYCHTYGHRADDDCPQEPMPDEPHDASSIEADPKNAQRRGK